MGGEPKGPNHGFTGITKIEKIIEIEVKVVGEGREGRGGREREREKE